MRWGRSQRWLINQLESPFVSIRWFLILDVWLMIISMFDGKLIIGDWECWNKSHISLKIVIIHEMSNKKCCVWTDLEEISTSLIPV